MVLQIRILSELLARISCLIALATVYAYALDAQATFKIEQETVTLHEPAVLVLKIQNRTENEVLVDLGVARTQFLRFSLTTPQGKTLHSTSQYSEGFHESGTVLISPHGEYEQQILVNQWFTLDDVGRYTLRAEVLSADLDKLNGPSPPGQVLAFEVRPRNEGRLRKLCAELAGKVESAPNAQAAQEPAFLLSYVQDPVAVPYLAQVVRAHKLVESAAVSGLERIANDDAVDILISELNSQYGDLPNLSRQALQRILGKSADRKLKERIRNAGVI